METEGARTQGEHRVEYLYGEELVAGLGGKPGRDVVTPREPLVFARSQNEE